MRTAKVYCLATILMVGKHAFAENKHCHFCEQWYDTKTHSHLCPHGSKEGENRFLHTRDAFNDMGDMARLSLLDEAMHGSEFKIKRFPVAQLIPQLSHLNSDKYNSVDSGMPWLMSAAGYLLFLLLDIVQNNYDIPGDGFISQNRYESGRVNQCIEFFIAGSLSCTPRLGFAVHQESQAIIDMVGQQVTNPTPLVSNIEQISSLLARLASGDILIFTLSPFPDQNDKFHFQLLFYNSHFLLVTHLGVVTVNGSVILSQQQVMQAILTFYYFFFGHTHNQEPVVQRAAQPARGETLFRWGRRLDGRTLVTITTVLITLFVGYKSS